MGNFKELKAWQYARKLAILVEKAAGRTEGARSLSLVGFLRLAAYVLRLLQRRFLLC